MGEDFKEEMHSHMRKCMYFLEGEEKHNSWEELSYDRHFISDFYNAVIVGKPRSILGVPTFGRIFQEPIHM